MFVSEEVFPMEICVHLLPQVITGRHVLLHTYGSVHGLIITARRRKINHWPHFQVISRFLRQFLRQRSLISRYLKCIDRWKCTKCTGEWFMIQLLQQIRLITLWAELVIDLTSETIRIVWPSRCFLFFVHKGVNSLARAWLRIRRHCW